MFSCLFYDKTLAHHQDSNALVVPFLIATYPIGTGFSSQAHNKSPLPISLNRSSVHNGHRSILLPVEPL